MSFVKLKKRFFVNNTVKAKNNVFYKESDPTTWLYDNHLNTKNVISLDNISNINLFDFSGEDDPSQKLDLVNSFFNDVIHPKSGEEYSVRELLSLGNFNTFFNLEKFEVSKRIAVLKNTVKYNSITNEDISAYKFRNHFKVNKIRSKFLVDDPYLYKRNVIKNNLYKYYRENSNDIYKDLEYGFCNYNTINFFSLNSGNRHSNGIVYANPKTNGTRLYDFLNGSFTINFKVIFRNEDYLDEPNCFLHIPGFLNLYFVKSKSNTIRIAASTGVETYKNILNISEFQNRIKPDDPRANDDFFDAKGFVTGSNNSLNMNLKNWHNISVKFDQSTNRLKIFINENLYVNTTMVAFSNNTLDNNSFISLGNKFNYDNLNIDIDRTFDIIFGKDTSFGTANLEKYSLVNKDIFVSQNYENVTNAINIADVDIENLSNTQSFHGEFSDFRIYNTAKEDKIIKDYKNSYVTDLTLEKSLVFYVPVFYVPLEVREKQRIFVKGNKIQVSYNNYYNAGFSDSCGGLEINVSNYLAEFVNCCKPNVIINGSNKENIWKDSYNNSANLAFFVSETQDFYFFKKGERLFETYNKNLRKKISAGNQRLSNTYLHKNLLILPNDNGIPEVDFSIIDQFLSNNNLLDYNENQYKTLSGEIQPYNISLIDVSNNQDFLFDKAKFRDPQDTFTSELTYGFIDDNNENKQLIIKPGELGLNALSNILYHDSEITDFQFPTTGIISSSFNKSKSSYNITKSNPSMRNVFAEDYSLERNEKEIIEGIKYYRVPVPFSDINRDYDSIFTTIIDISNKFYNKNMLRRKLKLSDPNFITGNILNLQDNGLGGVYRADCESKVAEWNYVGHVFYKEGIVSLNNPIMSYFADSNKSDFEVTLKSEAFLHIKEINVPADEGIINNSQNLSYDSNLRHNEASFNSEESFVYITDINLHDENFNIVSRAKLARPIPKKDSDKMIFKLKMDY